MESFYSAGGRLQHLPLCACGLGFLSGAQAWNLPTRLLSLAQAGWGTAAGDFQRCRGIGATLGSQLSAPQAFCPPYVLHPGRRAQWRGGREELAPRGGAAMALGWQSLGVPGGSCVGGVGQIRVSCRTMEPSTPELEFLNLSEPGFPVTGGAVGCHRGGTSRPGNSATARHSSFCLVSKFVLRAGTQPQSLQGRAAPPPLGTLIHHQHHKGHSPQALLLPSGAEGGAGLPLILLRAALARYHSTIPPVFCGVQCPALNRSSLRSSTSTASSNHPHP